MPIDVKGARFVGGARCQAGRFDEVLQVLWAGIRTGIRQAPEVAPEGFALLEQGAARLAYVVSTKHRAAALRSVVPEPSKPADRLLVREATLAAVGEACCVSLAEWVEDRAGHRVEAKPAEPEIWRNLKADGKIDPSTPPPQLPTFTEVRVAINGAADSHRATVPDEQLASLQSELAYFRSLAHEQHEALRRRNAEIRLLRTPASPVEPDDSQHDPQGMPLASLGDLAAWAVQFEDDLVILPRALQAARKSPFDDVAAVETALRLLAGPYRQMRLGRLSKETWDEALRSARMRVTASAGEATYAQHDDAYFVRWRGAPRLLEWHLARGSNHDPRLTLRVYFFFDEDAGLTVVGYLPGHLPNTRS